MKSFCILLTSIVGLAAAGNPYAKQCSTVLGTKSLKSIPTTTSTHKTTATVFRTDVIQKTVTAALSSATKKTTTTVVTTIRKTLDPETDVSTIEATAFETSYIVAATMTDTTTVTTSISTDTILPTVTISAPGTFVPILDSLPDAKESYLDNPSPFKRQEISRQLQGVDKRSPNSASLMAAAAVKERGTQPNKDCIYPQRVDCVTTATVLKTATVTKTKQATTVTVKASTKTITVTERVTSTSTVVPDHVKVTAISTSKSTILATTTPHTTITSVITSTVVTAQKAGPTVHAMCSSENFADSTTSGGSFRNVNPVDGAGRDEITTDDAYDCCEACAGSSTCLLSAFVPASSTCFLYNGGTSNCDELTPCTVSLTHVAGLAASWLVVSNGRGFQVMSTVAAF